MNEEREERLWELLEGYIADRDGMVWAEDCISLLETACRDMADDGDGTGECDWRESRMLRRKVVEVTRNGGLTGKPSEQRALHQVARWSEERGEGMEKAMALLYYTAEIDSCICAGYTKKAMKLKKDILWLTVCVQRFMKQECRRDREE